MRSLLLTLALLAPVSAYAESAIMQPIVMPSLRAPAMIDVPLPPEAQGNGGDTIVLRNGTQAVSSTIRTDTVELMPEATLVRGPAAAPTVPKTQISAIFDGNRETVFQPVTSKTYVFVFSFARVITPHQLNVFLDSGSIDNINVRTGMTQKTLHDAFTGVNTDSSVALSAEQAQVVEVTITMNAGVAKIIDLSLTEERKHISFRAVPEGTYSLLYGPGVRMPTIVQTYTPPTDIQANATLGEPVPTDVTDDFDGIPADKDNCPAVWNAGQEDQDGDARGNACDNCPFVGNALQEDTDGNGVGNVCDDDDKDGIINSIDNCPLVKNTVQDDEDKDGIGNLCDTTDDRFTAEKPWILWVTIGMVVVALSVVSAMIFKQSA